MRKNTKNKTSKIERYKKKCDENPDFRRRMGKIGDFFDKYMTAYYIVCFIFAAAIIAFLVFIVWLIIPSEWKVLVSSITGVIFTALAAPLLISYIKNKEERRKNLLKVNMPLYDDLIEILIKLLANMRRLRNSKDKQSVDDYTEGEMRELAEPLENYVEENYSQMCLTFSSALIWDISDVYDECRNHSKIKYINVEYMATKCIRRMRKDIKSGRYFYINQKLMKIFDSKN